MAKKLPVVASCEKHLASLKGEQWLESIAWCGTLDENCHSCDNMVARDKGMSRYSVSKGYF